MSYTEDVNEAFDNILLAEEKLIDQSYEIGFEIGKQQGNTEAFHLGMHRIMTVFIACSNCF